MGEKLDSRDLYYVWCLVMNDVPQGLILGSKLFNTFIDDMDDRVEHSLSKFADNIKVGGAINVLEDRVVFERDVDKLDKSS